MTNELEPLAPPDEDLPPQRQMRFELRHVAVAGFIVGVLMHACLIMSVTGGGDGGSSGSTPSSESATPAGPTAAFPTPTRPPDRTNCDEIRGTDYRSEAERQWFITNCR